MLNIIKFTIKEKLLICFSIIGIIFLIGLFLWFNNRNVVNSVEEINTEIINTEENTNADNNTENNIEIATEESIIETEKNNIEINTEESISETEESIEYEEHNTEFEENIILPDSFKLDVEYIAQNPELPTGCEAVSLTTVLNFLGYDITKFEIVDNYLPQGEVGKTNPDYAFVGNPYSNNGYGCFAPAIVETANTYFEDINANDIAIDTSGLDIDSLLRYMYTYNRPIIFWASINMVAIKEGPKWILDDIEYTWRRNNHCLVLIGWNEDNYIFSDPLIGIKEYDKETVIQRYEQNLCNSVIILPKNEIEK